MTRSTISESTTRRKMFYGQFSVALTPLERMFLDFYAERYGKDRVDILRGMLRKYVTIDKNFPPDEFIKWAKSYIAREDNRDMKDVNKQQLAEYESTLVEEPARAKVAARK